MLTATAAGALLGALWFVPSANATADAPVRERSVTVLTTQARATTADPAGAVADGTRLADTGSFDSTPYVVGGAFCLTLGAGFVAYSVRRERLGV
ncbi:hypothetical protein GCM10020295_30050 [Streptomyces cinereospinus]